MTTHQLHLITGGDTTAGDPPAWRLDSDTIALGRRGIAEARAALRSLRPIDELTTDEPTPELTAHERPAA
ncbi:MAG: hypothetical protein AAGA17_07910 [Actinomycetota bacterium]